MVLYVLVLLEEEEEVFVDFNLLVIVEILVKVKIMMVGMVVMEFDLIEVLVVLFKNVVNGGVNVVYCWVDGNIGWIDFVLVVGVVVE